jgi:inosine-uridine nucleoside N-ribohydrolase
MTTARVALVVVAVLTIGGGCGTDRSATPVTRATAATAPATTEAAVTSTEPTTTSMAATAATVATTDVVTTTTVAAAAPTAPPPASDTAGDRIPVILDTDANNELDDQHAIAYLLANDAFEVLGLTVNRTRNGGPLDLHVAEAERIVAMMGRDVPVVAGADAGFAEIADRITEPGYDGEAAVDFIIETARARGPIVLLPIGKLTNVALALRRAPDIADDVRIVWLGSNYPFPGEYNQDNDEAALGFVLDTDVPFEIVLVRAGDDSGTAAVLVSLAEIRARMPGLGPTIDPPVAGRAGGDFASFGDYSVDLFEQALGDDDGAKRALYDLAAVAIVLEPSWATPAEIPAPELVDGGWIDRPDSPRTITIWERFDRDAIVESLYATLRAAG